MSQSRARTLSLLVTRRGSLFNSGKPNASQKMANCESPRHARRDSHIRQPAHHRDDFLEGRGMIVWTGEENLVTDIDHPFVACGKTVVIEAELFHGAGLEVFADDVGGVDQLEDQFTTFRLL